MDRQFVKKIFIILFILIMLSNLNLIVVTEAIIENPSKITIAVPKEYKPFSYIDEKGNVKGVIIDFWRAWSKANEVKVEFIMAPWVDTLELVKNGEADIHSGLFYSQDRAGYMDFGGSFLDIMTGVYVHKDIQAWDINDIKEIGVGVTQSNYARTYLQNYYPELKMHVYPNFNEVIEAAEKGEVKALVIDYHSTLSKVSRVYPVLKDYQLLQTIYTQPLRVGTQKGNTDMLSFVNEGIDNITYSEFRRLQSKWEYITIYLTRGKLTMYILIASLVIIALLMINIFVLRRKIRLGIARLAESENSYKKLIELCPDGIFVQCEEKIVFANEFAVNTFGERSMENILNRNFLSFVPKESRCSIQRRMNAMEKIHSTVPVFESKVIRSDGRLIDVEIIFNAIIYKGEKSTLTIIRDISSRKEKEKEEQRIFREKLKYERLKTEFFANISHELRTPLNIILGTIQLLDKVSQEKGELNYSYYKKYSKTMLQNSYRLLRLINNLIDKTKLDAGFMKMEFKNYNIVQVVEDITMSVADYIKSKGIDIVFDTDTEEKIISCDADKIERVLLNLFSNAVKFTNKEGSIYVNIYDKGDFVCISVKDTGIGIPKEEQKAIFERFRQVQPLLDREKEGSGIGLSLVKSIIESHNGDIYVESECGKGSEFIIELPCNVVEEVTTAVDVNNYSMDKVERIDIEFSDIYSI
ncbi:MAG: transporter substrate-binding domain-containing protein [Clostridiaceae bacterium]|nr:transporter substrate-binding domain-containing protein [Clostridiaceae bacterium]